MKNIITILIIFSLNQIGFAQDCNNFKNKENSIDVLMIFQIDVINSTSLKEEIETIFYWNDSTFENRVVWENLKENEPEISNSDPGIWVNKSVIDSINNLRWIKTNEIFKKGKWVYFHLEVKEKKYDKIQTIKTLKYKIKCDDIISCSGNKSCFKKISSLP